jgi:hypothetical protein
LEVGANMVAAISRSEPAETSGKMKAAPANGAWILRRPEAKLYRLSQTSLRKHILIHCDMATARMAHVGDHAHRRATSPSARPAIAGAMSPPSGHSLSAGSWGIA